MGSPLQPRKLKIVIIGLSITSSWGNGHATTYRGLAAELAALGHDILFLEKDVPWYSQNRDLPAAHYARVELYRDAETLRSHFSTEIRSASCVIVGSFIDDGIAIGKWVNATAGGITAFYDIDTPVTLRAIDENTCTYLTRAEIPEYDIYLSFTGGPTLKRLEQVYGASRARLLYCSSDPSSYFPELRPALWDLGYLGTYSEDRQPPLDRLLFEPAREWPQGRFIVAGPQYPSVLSWPENVAHREHIPPDEHRSFYNSQRLTLNITRADMIAAGYAPSIRLFEAAACGRAIISDYWPGLETVFRPDEEILIARNPEDVLRALRDLSDERLMQIGMNARKRVMEEHTGAHRALALESYICEAFRDSLTGAETA
jgi:spore maturation protein CgeB